MLVSVKHANLLRKFVTYGRKLGPVCSNTIKFMQFYETDTKDLFYKMMFYNRFYLIG